MRSNNDPWPPGLEGTIVILLWWEKLVGNIGI